VLDQGTGRVGRPERLVSRDVREDFVVIPWILRFLRRLDLDQDEIVDHQIIVAQLAVAGEEVLDRGFPHLGGDLQRVVGAACLDGVQIIHDR